LNKVVDANGERIPGTPTADKLGPASLMFVSTGEIVTHFVEDGQEAGPPIVFINSLGTDLRIWDQVIRGLRTGYRVIRYDKRGHGLSDCPPGPYRLEHFADDLDHLRKKLDLSAMAVIGISIGGLIALEYALRYPESVSTLILCDTSARIGSEKLWMDRMVFVNSQGMAQAAPDIIPIWFADSYEIDHPAEHQGYLNMLARTPREGYVASCAALRDGDLRERVRQINVKTLVITGREDKASPPEQGQALADTLPDARFEIIDGAGHLACIEQPDLLAQKIEGFLLERGHV
jgi:3-oxoadipate enol-lactonase